MYSSKTYTHIFVYFCTIDKTTLPKLMHNAHTSSKQVTTQHQPYLHTNSHISNKWQMWMTLFTHTIHPHADMHTHTTHTHTHLYTHTCIHWNGLDICHPDRNHAHKVPQNNQDCFKHIQPRFMQSGIPCGRPHDYPAMVSRVVTGYPALMYIYDVNTRHYPPQANHEIHPSYMHT